VEAQRTNEEFYHSDQGDRHEGTHNTPQHSTPATRTLTASPVRNGNY